MQTEGRNWANNQQITVEAKAEERDLQAGEPDPLFLLMDLRLHHWGRKRFASATKAMAARYGWGLTRFWAARDALVELGVIREAVRATNREPALYAWNAQGISSGYQY